MTKGNQNIREKFKTKTKGDLISDSFSFWVKSAKKSCQITFLTSPLYVDIAKESGLAPFFGYLSQS